MNPKEEHGGECPVEKVSERPVEEATSEDISEKVADNAEAILRAVIDAESAAC